jgi:hypothetical protein
MKTDPSILTHPNIPKPLHGLSPRAVLGQTWWDKQRELAYKSTNYTCLACGTPKTEAEYHKWLEAHEYYHYDYKHAVLRLKKIVPLCHACHNFIHSGRMFILYQKGSMKKQKIVDIIKRGLFILENNNLNAFYGTLEVANELGITTNVKAEPLEVYDTEWSDWRMIIKNKVYRTKFKNEEEWAEYYA